MIYITFVRGDVKMLMVTLKSVLMILGVLLVGVGGSAFSYMRMKRLREMKQRCAVKVPAVCIGTDVQYHFGRRGKYLTATYEYDYMGVRYRGCNNIETDFVILGMSIVNSGDRVDILIDPDGLPGEIFDPIAERKMKGYAFSTAASLIIPLMMLIPYFSILQTIIFK